MNYDAILIDDDILVQMTWKMAAKRAGRSLAAFSSPSEFLASATHLDRHTPVYIDSNLGDGIRGEESARELAALGFTEIWLCTGYSSIDFGPMPWIRGIRGKESPWA